jgi:hypothetical protein
MAGEVTMTGRIATRRAFVVGINGYHPGVASPLRSAMHDAVAFRQVLAPPRVDADDPLRVETWFDPATPRWEVALWCDNSVIPQEFTGSVLRRRARDFFDHRTHDVEGVDLLFYFSGHAIRTSSTELVGPDGEGIGFGNLMEWANDAAAAHARSITIILDCCLSGDVGDRRNPDPFVPSQQAIVPSNCSILTASSADEEAKEGPTHGRFTEHVLGGLRGAAADILGDVTPLSLYSHVSFAFAGQAQSPAFKSYAVVRTPVLTRVVPQVTRAHVATLAHYFPPGGDDSIQLTIHHEGVGPEDPAYDPELDRGYVKRGEDGHEPFVSGSQPQRDLDHLKVFRDSHLLRSKDGRDFYFLCTKAPAPGSAQSDLAVLTPLGRYYRDLAAAGSIVDPTEDWTR